MALRWIENETRFVADVADVYNNVQGQLSTSNSAAQTGQLEEGLYDLWADENVYIKIATNSSDVTTNNGYLLRSGNTVTFVVRHKHKIGAVLLSGTGTLRYHKVS